MKHVDTFTSSYQLFLSKLLIITKAIPLTPLSRVSSLSQRKRVFFHGFLTTEVLMCGIMIWKIKVYLTVFASFSYPSRPLWRVIRHSKTSHHIINLKVFKKHKIQGDEG
uniref:Uncharacterized protein n=1 Tax=Lepeophtheirus salmonis TaxID=72036 RepID=A0A0K2VAP3_LEPSM